MINRAFSKHLTDIENIANKKINLIFKQLASSKNVDKALKYHN